MADAIIGSLASQFGAMLEQQIREEIRLVRGVEKDVRNLEATFDSIQAVILDAEKKQVKEANVRLWLQRLRDALYDMDDVLADWSAALFKAKLERLENRAPKEKVLSCITSPPCFYFRKFVQRHKIALRIKELNEKLEQIANEKQKYSLTSTSSNSEAPDIDRLNTTSYVEAYEVRGRDDDKTNLISKLLKETSESESKMRLNLISLVGMGGIGKTTLAGLAYNASEVKDHFEMRMWAVVSEPFDMLRIAKSIIEDTGRKPSDFSQLEPLLRHLRESIENKKYLLVLDDAWTDNSSKWEPLISSLNVGAIGSTILVTTRNERVAKCMGCNDMLHLHVLSDEECWNLFSQHASLGRGVENLKHLERIGRKIAKKCKGLPLAAKAIGSLMRFKDTAEEWQHVLDSDMWELEKEEDVGVFPPLLLSYHALRPALRRCFSYCAIFPKDCWIKADKLIRMWMAQGYLSPKQDGNMEVIGRQYLKELETRCLLQEVTRYGSDKIVKFKMHDMVHDLAMYLTKNECSMMYPSRATIRHLTLVRPHDISFPTFIRNNTKLHTFRVQYPPSDEAVKLFTQFFQNHLYMKVLEIRESNLHQVPKEIGLLLNLRYLNLSKNPSIDELPDNICDLYNLQTLNLKRCGKLERLPPRIGKLNKLRHLNLSHTPIIELPDTICELYNLQTIELFECRKLERLPPNLGKLNNLSYLCLARTPLIELPDTICELYNLRTLNLNACSNLEKLPPRIGKLNNLRSLSIVGTDRLSKLPKEIGKLCCLQTLNKFILSSGMDDKEATCNLGDLRDLNQLRGRIELDRLGYVTNVADAFKAELKKKKLKIVIMDFGPLLPTSQPTSEMLEALELHQDVQRLSISSYCGAHFPSWTVSLNNLRFLGLADCPNCIILPPLGKLQSLETLHIENMDGVQRIGVEFLGVETNGNGGKEENIHVLFPNLEKLKFTGMSSWKEWGHTNAVREVEDGSLKIMPRLRLLHLEDCMKLENLPEILLEKAPIEKLRIKGCPGLHREYGTNTDDQWPMQAVEIS